MPLRHLKPPGTLVALDAVGGRWGPSTLRNHRSSTACQGHLGISVPRQAITVGAAACGSPWRAELIRRLAGPRKRVEAIAAQMRSA